MPTNKTAATPHKTHNAHCKGAVSVRIENAATIGCIAKKRGHMGAYLFLGSIFPTTFLTVLARFQARKILSNLFTSGLYNISMFLLIVPGIFLGVP
jgi:hypothetical protein